MNGIDKSTLDTKFRANVVNPQEKEQGKEGYLIHQMVDGEKISFVDICMEILSDPARKHGTMGYDRRKRNMQQQMDERVYIVRGKNEAFGKNIKMTATGFEKGKYHGIGSHYNF